MTGHFVLKSGVKKDFTCLWDGGQWSKTVAVPKESNLGRF